MTAEHPPPAKSIESIDCVAKIVVGCDDVHTAGIPWLLKFRCVVIAYLAV